MNYALFLINSLNSILEELNDLKKAYDELTIRDEEKENKVFSSLPFEVV